MFYEFPRITNLQEVYPAIKGRDEFIVAERDWGFVVNYNVNFEDTFPAPFTQDATLNHLYMIRRECRGLKFDRNGKILARPHFKFFNLGERPETDPSKIDFGQHFIILDKLDGSMAHPIYHNNEIIMCTKMGDTDIAAPIQTFVEQGKSYEHGRIEDARYMDFMMHCILQGKTPIFEWCSRKQRIVVDYGSDDHLYLTAIRDNHMGAYLGYNEMVSWAAKYNVPCVRRWQGTFAGISDFVREVQANEGEEGYVIRFNMGHMLKIKNMWYLQLHKTKELLAFEKDVWALIIDNKQDDAKAFMEDSEKARIDAFAHDLYVELDKTADRLNWIVIAAKDNFNDSKKRFAIEIVQKHAPDIERGLLFKIWDGNEAKKVVYEYVRSQLGTGSRLESVRCLAGGIVWGGY